MDTTTLHNPQLDGSPFFLKGGEKGILFIHGFTATPSEVRRIAVNLNKAGFTTSGPLLPGHAETPAALNRTRWQNWYSAVEKAYQELAGSCTKVYVAGESLGGLLALLLAARTPAAAGVMVYAPALQIQMSWLQELQLRIFSHFVAAMPKGDLSGNTTWQGYKVNPLKGVLQLRALQRVVKSELKNVRQPLLVMQGRLDQTIDQRSAELVYNGVSSKVKEIHWFEKSGHTILLDQELHLATRLTMDFIWKT